MSNLLESTVIRGRKHRAAEKNKRNLQLHSLSMIKYFKKYFSVELANTAEMKQKAFSIRYQVYCKEFNYKPIERYPNEIETDEYDDASLHCLITHRTTNIPAACVRLVPDTIGGRCVQLPFEKTCAESLNDNVIQYLKLECQKKCEFSRFAIDAIFRKTSVDKVSYFGELEPKFSHLERRTFSILLIAPFLAATALTHLSGRTNVFAIMEPFLVSVLKRVGISMRRVGGYGNYSGIRAVYFITHQEVLDNMRPELFELYEWIYKEFKSTYNH